MNLSIFTTSIMKKHILLIISFCVCIGLSAQWEYVYETSAQYSTIHGISFVNDSTGYIGVRAYENNENEFSTSISILRTQDYGLSWDTVFFEINYCPCGEIITREITDVHFINESVGFFSVLSAPQDACQIVATNDGGETWTEHEFPLWRLDQFDFLNENYGICYSPYGNGVETFDGGQTWTVSDLEFSRAVHLFDECNKMGVYAGWLRREQNCIWSQEYFPTVFDEPSRTGSSIHAWDFDQYIMGAGGILGFDNFTSIIRTEDGGETYTYLDFPFGSGTGDFTFVNDSTGYISTYSGSSFYQSTYQTTDRGITWQGVNTPFNDDGKYESLSDPSWVNEDVCYSINSNRTKILRTLTGVGELGQSWTMVPEHEREVKLSVYPNPATSFITIESEAPMQSLTLFNLLGERVAFQSFNGLTTTLEVNALPTGVYFLEVGFEIGSVVKKVVIE